LLRDLQPVFSEIEFVMNSYRSMNIDDIPIQAINWAQAMIRQRGRKETRSNAERAAAPGPF
jgi:hypothetical protein